MRQRRKVGPCMNTSELRKAHGKRPYQAPTRKVHTVLAAYWAHCKLRGIPAGY